MSIFIHRPTCIQTWISHALYINLSLESSHVSSIACSPGLLSSASFLICLLSFWVFVKAAREDGPSVISTPRRLQLMFTRRALMQQQMTAWSQPTPRVRSPVQWGAPWGRWGMPPAPCHQPLPYTAPGQAAPCFLGGAACAGAVKERCCRRIPSVHLLLMTVMQPTLPSASRIYRCSNKWSIFGN